jgi:hypothetical protein
MCVDAEKNTVIHQQKLLDYVKIAKKMKKEEIKKHIKMCQAAEKDLVNSINDFIPYWKVVEQTKKQISILSAQRRHLEGQLCKLKK